jgi:GNAT superfamily N-acetyltransferase
MLREHINYQRPFPCSGDLVGFICGTLSASARLEEATMSEHDPLGSSLCVHSVVVSPGFQRKGLATWMVKRFVQRVAAMAPSVSRLLLLTHTDKKELYERCGFASRGKSAVIHGAMPWLEMER